MRIAPQHLAEVGRERVEVAQLRVGDLDALAPRPPAGLADRAVRAAPAEHQQLGVARRVVDLEIRHGDAVDLRLPQPHHQVVVLRLVGDVARAVGGFQTTDAVLEARRARDRELAGQGLRVAGVRLERLTGLGEGVRDRLR